MFCCCLRSLPIRGRPGGRLIGSVILPFCRIQCLRRGWLTLFGDDVDLAHFLRGAVARAKVSIFDQAIGYRLTLIV